MKVLQVGHEFLNIAVIDTPIEDIGNYNSLISEMINTCIEMKGIGLSANQVGESVRMFIMKDLKTGDWNSYFNPIILSGSGRHRDLEGCLSFREPIIEYYVRRKLTIELAYYNIGGEKLIKEFRDLEARCVQHEISHLNGITMNMEGKLK